MSVQIIINKFSLNMLKLYKLRQLDSKNDSW